MTMIVVWSIVPCVFEVNFEKNHFVTFFLVYCIGAHLRLYPNSWYYKRYKSIFILCVLLWGCMAISILFEPSLFTEFLKRLNTNGSILVVGIGTSMFLFAISTNIGYSKIVNVTAGTVGGVYLLHENPYVRSLLYSKIFHLEKYTDTDYMFFATILFTLITFVVCSLVEFVRKHIYSHIENAVVNKFLQ